jgi:tRNA nucleotidyltransferase/poly(A) polymerase
MGWTKTPQDMRRGVLRTVGEAAQRLRDDGLRVWRAYRFLDAGAAGMRAFDGELREALARPEVLAASARISRYLWWRLRPCFGGRAARVAAA